jgi:HAD superfamily hydrolase (TIGR01509 family)
VPRPAAVIFDNDGTFLATEDAWSRAESALFARWGRVLRPEHKRELLGTSFAEASRHLERFLEAPGHGSRLLEELAELVHAELDHGVPVMPGAAELVAALDLDGVPIAMATNAARGFAEKALAAAGHAHTFDVLLTADDVPSPKPAPDIYVAAAEALGVRPEACVAVEDSPTGVRSARDAGMLVVGVLSHPGVELDAHHVVPTLNDPLIWDLLGLELVELG